ncbi:MAG: DNA polymerase III subunit beta [Lachnospiraceae bacterium]|nr:DNA polymerase III subunit beta [Candidatus Equihabitans merdae]
MKIICRKSDLVKAVSIALRAVAVRSISSIQECILITAAHGYITLTSNNLEMCIETKVEGEIEVEGKIALDAKMLSDIVRKLPEEEVTIRTDDHMVATILCGKAVFNISGKDGEDFSGLPVLEKEDRIEISQLTLKDVISKTIFSIAQTDSNRILTGELFEINGSGMKVVALDSHRVAIQRVELKESYGHKKVIIPGKTLNEMTKILSGEADDIIGMYCLPNHVIFEMEGTTVVSALIEGEYIDIDRMLSRDYETKVKINRQVMLGCIDRATLFVREGDKKPIIMDIQDGFMKLNIDSVLGSMDEDIDIEKEGRDIMIGFNPKFMVDALRAISDEDVSLYFLNPKAPCFIRNDKESYTYIILPVNFVR